MVHLHDTPAAVHLALNSGILPTVFLPRHGIPLARHLVSLSYRQRAEAIRGKGRWLLCPLCSLYGMVQRIRWSGRFEVRPKVDRRPLQLTLCSNSFFVVPVAHFPWSEKGREARRKSESATV